MAAIPQHVIDTVWTRVRVAGPDECWPWKMSIGSHGYGQASWSIGEGRSAGTTAHRVAWVAANGPIPDDLTVDHLCHNRLCCNPAHMQLLSLVDNAKRNRNSQKTECPRGHAYDDENTYITRLGHRRCRECARTSDRARS